MSADRMPPELGRPNMAEVAADDALLDRLAAGEWTRGDCKDPAAAVLADLLAAVEQPVLGAAPTRRRVRRAAVALPVIAGVLLLPAVGAAALAGDPWAPYRTALAPLGLTLPGGPAAPANPSPSAPQDTVAARSLDAAEAAWAAGDVAGAQRLLDEAAAALPAAEDGFEALFQRLRVLAQAMAPGASAASADPAGAAQSRPRRRPRTATRRPTATPTGSRR